MKNKDLLELWYIFTDVPIDKDECIDEDFHLWPKGTDRFDIWHWFDEQSPNGVYEMLYNRIPKANYS